MNSCTYRLHLLTDVGEIWFLLTAVERFCFSWYWFTEIHALSKGINEVYTSLLSFPFNYDDIRYRRIPQASVMCLLVAWKYVQWKSAVLGAQTNLCLHLPHLLSVVNEFRYDRSVCSRLNVCFEYVGSGKIVVFLWK